MINVFTRIILIFAFCISYAYANTVEPIVVNAIITPTEISFSPAAIPEDIPFIVHVINKTGVPVELENADTSVEVYDGTDKTFKIGLNAGKYKFFNDFNPKTKTADLHVLTATQIAAGASSSNTANNNTTPDEASNSPSASDGNSKLAEITFIMWRESIEALLVVGIVYSWLKQLKTGRREGMMFLAAGIGVGVLCAVILGTVLVKLSGSLSGSSQEYLQASLTFAAALMIVYMVKWMRSNGAKLKSEMLGSLAQNEARRWNISILIVVAVAIAREGSEAVIFIYAIGFGEKGIVSLGMLASVGLGLALAVFTIWLLSMGNKIFSWRYFFKFTEVLLLLLGGALLLNCVDILVSIGVLPVIKAKFWDTSFILGDGGRFVPMLTSIVGYRATPSFIDILVYALYWVGVTRFIKVKAQAKKQKA